MSRRRPRISEIALTAAGVAVAGAAVRVLRQSRVIARRGAGDRTPFGSLRAPARTVIADDGVPLHVEVDEVPGSPLTVLFVHGYALTLDCWHFQRAAYRGQLRMVFYDQRSHGRSGRSHPSRATIDQLGEDLRSVIEHECPDGPVVLVGHSMGGMSVIALAEHHPELFGDKVVGVGLLSTAAGGLTPHQILLPRLPRTVGGDVALRIVSGLARATRMVEGVRRAGRDALLVATDKLAFGDRVPASYVEFVDQMLASTSFDVLAEFFPSLHSIDKYDVLHALERVPTVVVCGTDDRITPVDLSRVLHEQIPGSTLLECQGAGHMVIMERHEEVNDRLDDLVALARGQRPAEPA